MPASSEELGAGVRIAAQAPGELHAPESGAFLTARDLKAGGRAVRATLPVKNVTRAPVNVRLRATRGGRDLDRALHLELRANGRMLASGELGELRRWSRPVRVDHAGAETIHARAWIAAGAEDYEGRDAAFELELDAQLVRSSRR